MKCRFLLILFVISICSSCQSGQSKADSKAQLQLHDIWVLEKTEDKVIDVNDLTERPRLEINLTEMQLMGFDGCNNFSGSLEEVDNQNITFGPVVSTKKMCSNMAIPNTINQVLSGTKPYKVDNLKLHLYDTKGNLLLTFQKTD